MASTVQFAISDFGFECGFVLQNFPLGPVSSSSGYLHSLDGLQGQLQHFVDRPYGIKSHLFPHIRRQIVQVGLVALRKDDFRKTGRLRRHYFLLQASDRQDAALQSHLTRHSDGALHWPAREQRGERRDHGDPRTGPIFGNSTRGDVHVKLPSFECMLVNSQLGRMTFDIAQRDSGGFLHDVAELAGEDQSAMIGHRCRFNEKHIPADAGYRETRSHTRNGGPGCSFVVDFRPAECLANGDGIYGDRRLRITRSDCRGCLAQQSTQFALQLPDAGFTCIVGDNPSQHPVFNSDLLGAQAVAFDLAWPKVAASNRHFLVRRVPVEANNFHPVQKGSQELFPLRLPLR